MQGMVKVRFAPSPTGVLHVGSIRTALFDYFFAKAQGGQFILRNEDTDQQRLVKGALDLTLESFRWLGISWDDLVTQSERLEYYKKYAERLVSEGKARDEEGAIRFITPKEGSTNWTDAIGNKEILFENKDIEDFIILKKDGFPTYHLANVVDDHLMEITHVIRGEDWIPSTPKHIMLYQAFGWQHPVFAHVPNVNGTDHKKLSKRRGAKSVIDFKNEGILADALLNYLMLLGWSPKNDQEILSKEEIEKEFSLENVNSSPAIFDEQKLLWMNGEYIRALAQEKLIERLLEFDPEISSITNFEQYIPLAQTRMKTLAEFKNLIQNNNSVEYSEDQKKLAKILIEKLELFPDWSSDEISKVCMDARDTLSLKTKDIFVVLSGRPQGLPFQEKAQIDGKEKTIQFIKSHV